MSSDFPAIPIARNTEEVVGIAGMVTREADAVHHILVASTHDHLLFFTNRGKVYQLRGYEVPDASRQAKGTPIINLVSIDQNERVTAIIAVPNFDEANASSWPPEWGG